MKINMMKAMLLLSILLALPKAVNAAKYEFTGNYNKSGGVVDFLFSSNKIACEYQETTSLTTILLSTKDIIIVTFDIKDVVNGKCPRYYEG